MGEKRTAAKKSGQGSGHRKGPDSKIIHRENTLSDMVREVGGDRVLGGGKEGYCPRKLPTAKKE